MSDDIVTRLEHDLFQAARDSKSEQKRLLLERALNVVRVAEQRRKREEIMADEIERLRAERDRWAVMAERLYDIMLAHESVSDDDWNQGIHDCWLLMTGKNETSNSNS